MGGYPNIQEPWIFILNSSNHTCIVREFRFYFTDYGKFPISFQ